MSFEKEDMNHLSSVKNALRMLKSFTMDEPERKIGDLAESLGLNKSTVSRTMATLASEGFVYKDPETKKYRLGYSILSLSGVVNSNMDVYRESMPIINKLVETTGETSHISIMDNLEVVYLQKVECNHPVRVLTHVGRRNPLYCTSSGKVFLAFSKDQELLDKVIENGLKQYTKKTITDPNKLKEHIKEIRLNGYAYSYEEYNEGVHSIAAPVYDYRGRVIAALSMVGPKQRIQYQRLNNLAKRVIHAADEISSRMGYWK